MTEELEKEIQAILDYSGASNIQDFFENKNYNNDDYYYTLSLSDTFILSEAFMEQFQNNINWEHLLKKQKLSEVFIRKLNLIKKYSASISKTQKLSEAFIEEFQDDVNWHIILQNQPLSEAFLRKFIHKYDITDYAIAEQKLSEDFIRDFITKLDLFSVLQRQKLSEAFIEEFIDEFIRQYFVLIEYQILSESLIEKINEKIIEKSKTFTINNKFFSNDDYFARVAKYQKLSPEFIKKHNIDIPENNLLYWSREEKLKLVQDTGLYEIIDDWVYAYKGIRSDRYSNYNFLYQYLPGKTYYCHANHNINEEHSFGFSSWNYENAKAYCDELVIQVKFHIDDLAAVVHNGNKLRSTSLTIID